MMWQMVKTKTKQELSKELKVKDKTKLIKQTKEKQ